MHAVWSLVKGQTVKKRRKEPETFRVGSNFNSKHRTTETGSKRIVEKNHVPSKVTKVDRVHVAALPNMEDSNPKWEITKSDALKHLTRELQENGKVKRLMGKLEEKKALLARHP
nr:hypothetical protein CFP56_06096 [Quercus suber]